MSKTTRAKCDICAGSGFITLPKLRTQLTAIGLGTVEVEPAEIISRRFPCPQCSETITIEKVCAARAETFADLRYVDESEFIDHIKRYLADELAAFLLKENFIIFERRPPDTTEMRFEMRATLDVVHPDRLDMLERQIAARQTEIAKEVVDHAIAGINNWGSYYGNHAISKITAIQFMKDAVQYVLKKRTEWKREKTK